MTLRTYPDVEQRSDEWHELRCGIVTASLVGGLVTVGPPAAVSVACPTCNVRPGEACLSVARKQPTELKSLHDTRLTAAASRPPVVIAADNDTSRGLTTQLVAERITGVADSTFISEDMWRGIEHEPFAIENYAEHYAPVTPMGFMRREEAGYELGAGWTLGYSPDGLVGDDGLVEVKCPRAKSHLRTILADEVPAHYMPQLQAGLLVSGRKWIDFISFTAGMPLWVRRVEPDPQWFQAITAAVTRFEETAAEMVADYLELTTGLPATERIDMEIF